MTDVNMPKLSDTMEEGTVLEWKKADGDQVKKGEVLAEVESDKASFEIEAEADGVLSIVVDKGKPVPVGQVIAHIGEAGEAAPARTEKKPGPPKAEAKREEPRPQPKAAEPERPEPPVDARPAPTDGAQRASPLARRLAAEMGVDLAAVKGSGPEGRIVKEDVLAAAEKAPGQPARAAREARPAGPDVERQELGRAQAIIARRMAQSKAEVPHFYVTVEVRMERALDLQKQVREAVPGGEKVSLPDLLIRACALGLRAFPQVNAAWAGDHVQLKGRVNIGYAVAQPHGLVVPVLRDADRKDLVQISTERRALVERAQAGRPTPQDLEGGTFSISNLGTYGVEQFAAIVNQPEAMILAVGGVSDQAVVEDGQVRPGKVMRMTASVDHRVVYGAEAAEFLAEVRRLLENPVTLALA